MAALLGYAEKVTLNPATMTETDVNQLRRAGWSDRTIHDATQVIGYFAYINRIADALGVKREDGLTVWGEG